MKNGIFDTRQREFLAGLGMTMGLRQLSMIILMPLLPIYAAGLAGSNSFLSGIAVGAFGLFQAIFMVPFGKISDNKGRKPVIVVGLIILIIGILFGAFAKNIYMLIVSRAMQGSGAIMSVCYSWVGDSIPQDKKNRAMSILGISVGLASTFGFLGGSLLLKIMTIPTLFIVCAVLIFIAFIYMVFVVKEDKKETQSSEPLNFKYVLANPDLLKLTIIGIVVNFTLIAAFFIVPNILNDNGGQDDMWKVFVPAIIVGIIVMRIAAKQADKGRAKYTIITAFVLFAISGVVISGENIVSLLIGMTLFMSGFMILNTIVPGVVTSLAPQGHKGSITGVYNTAQCIGSFIGGALTGALWDMGLWYVLGMFILMSLVAFFLTISLKNIDVEKQSESIME